MLTHLDVGVATYLSRRFKKDRGTTTASYNKIAKDIRCCRRAAIDSVGRLMKHGFLALHKRGNSYLKEANEYILLQPPLVQQMHQPLVQQNTGTSAAKYQGLVQQSAPLSTEEVPQSYSLGERDSSLEEKEGRKGSGERSEIDGESESSILYQCDRLLQRHSDNPTRLLSALRQIRSAREILELVSAAVSSGRDVEGELRHVLGQRRIAG
jgi:hypothetical protein